MKPINNTNSFSLKRLWKVIKCNLVENRAHHIGIFLLMFITFLGFQLFEMRDLVERCHFYYAYPETPETSGFHPSDCMAILARRSNAALCNALILALAWAAAKMCATPLKNKMKATSFLMMPASNLEKFVALAFIHIVLVIMMAYAALFCADLVRMLCIPFYEVKTFYEFTVPFLSRKMFYLSPIAGFGLFGFGVTRFNFDYYLTRTGFTPLIGVMTLGLYFLSIPALHSFFVLGGSIWRKGSFIKTLSIGFVAIYALTWSFTKIEPYITYWYYDTFTIPEATVHTILTIGIPLCIAITVLNWRLSYRAFTRKQVVMPENFLTKLQNERKEEAV